MNLRFKRWSTAVLTVAALAVPGFVPAAASAAPAAVTAAPGGPGLGPDPAPALRPSLAAALPGLGPQITRSEILARAKRWYDWGNVNYSQDQSDAVTDGDSHKYRPDCSGRQ